MKPTNRDELLSAIQDALYNYDAQPTSRRIMFAEHILDEIERGGANHSETPNSSSLEDRLDRLERACKDSFYSQGGQLDKARSFAVTISERVEALEREVGRQAFSERVGTVEAELSAHTDRLDTAEQTIDALDAVSPTICAASRKRSKELAGARKTRSAASKLLTSRPRRLPPLTPTRLRC